MQLAIHPGMFTYLQDLVQYGIAYHQPHDFMDFMDPQMLEDDTVEQRVELFCPSFSLCLWRAFHTEEIVGVKFEQPVAAALFFTRRIPDDPHTLLEWCDELLQHWSLGGFPHLKMTQASVAEALDMHAKARAFLNKHYASTRIPSSVHAQMVAEWQRRSTYISDKLH